MERMNPAIVVVGVVLLIVLLVVGAYFTDLLGARLIVKGSPRLKVEQGEKVTLQLAVSSQVRKLEICVEKKNTKLGYSDFSNCRPLKYVVGAGVKQADVTIPKNMPLGRAVVITRLRDGSGRLVPAAPTDEKIALYVIKAKPKAPAVEPEGDSGGGGNGGGGGDNNEGGGGYSGTGNSDNDSGGGDVPNKDRALAFPGAAGFGAYAQGGRGGDVYHVTNLNNSGAGSLREGIDSAVGPRTIVFDVSGTIELSARIYIKKPYLTLAGQTAPGDGITVSKFGVAVLDTHDVVIRYMRFRTGDTVAAEHDALLVYRSNNVIYDHVSVSWGIDENLPTGHSEDVTVQWSLISEGLDDSHHSKGLHSAGALHYGGSLSFHHNLLAHNAIRNPKVLQRADVVNNVIYNWSRLGGSIGLNSKEEDPSGPTKVNFQNNYYIAGPSTENPNRFYYIFPGSQFWPSGIYFDNNRNGVLDGTLVKPWPKDSRTASSRFDFPLVPTDDTLTAYDRVLAEAGASLRRDAVDVRVINDVINQTGQVIDSQTEVGGWPELHSTTPPSDSDQDGMSDQWESLFDHLDPHDPSDGALDPDGDGYTNLEDYLAAVAA